MSIVDQTTVLIITYNEENNIARMLKNLAIFKNIIILDSGSTDNTIKIVNQFSNCRVIYRNFDSFAEQCNFGLSCITTKWVLSLDSDFITNDEFIKELRSLSDQPDVAGYTARFRYCIEGQPIRGGIYPPRTVLFRTLAGQYVNQGHGHHLQLNGKARFLTTYLYHDDRKNFDRWINSQKKYCKIEADYILNKSEKKLVDFLRYQCWIMPFLVPIFILFLRGAILSGRRGLIYAWQRCFTEILIALEILERRACNNTSPQMSKNYKPYRSL